jgi:hypothetical protein
MPIYACTIVLAALPKPVVKLQTINVVSPTIIIAMLACLGCRQPLCQIHVS